MNLVLLVTVFVISCVGISLEGASKLEEVKVGAIFSVGTINGQVAKIAMQAAEDDINSDPRILGGRKLTITLHDSNFSGFLGIMGGKVS